MKRRRFQFVRLLSAALVGLTVQAGGAQGGVIQIFNPDAAYTSSTSKVLIPGSEGQVFKTMTDGALSISLSSSASHLVVPGSSSCATSRG